RRAAPSGTIATRSSSAASPRARSAASAPPARIARLARRAIRARVFAMRLEDRVRAEAAALGFTSCGFAAAAPTARGAFLEGWLGAGFAGGMHYLGRHPERRLTVAGILPRARTVI